ncbi:MAG: type II toxin-antitoxin system RelE/ParE family toxin [Paludibacterium sp.]|uniref:type II toxin-antitoxin system RelE/ParE family toxin n=1 Tax=Paludibacterium sp. TaxID=1917523 RepID=UPI0025E544B6|nr:type II toxin-antitoxin system RelE/ParE family toxin [Paludibacterium sp.]MBV8048554.1 type II toxin-antitoxin system RelE/ParE family toxin [Paludibacterium sp.]MBV8647831.1 type II toxin-antitoxin system RelE/ParE family toxin [Paludibacterium sp.]
MRVFKNAWFERFARKQRISDKVLLAAIECAEQGQIDADLGGGVIKQRLARVGQGKSGGFRSIIFYRAAGRAFFVYGFAKSDQDNIDANEVAQFKKAAAHVLGLTDEQLAQMICKGQFSEVQGNGEKVPE